MREGNLQAPTRHPIDWKNPDFYSEASCEKELERIFDICHGCRRCVSLCNAFPTLFDYIDEAGDAVIHVMLPDVRIYYDLENLWRPVTED